MLPRGVLATLFRVKSCLWIEAGHSLQTEVGHFIDILFRYLVFPYKQIKWFDELI